MTKEREGKGSSAGEKRKRPVLSIEQKRGETEAAAMARAAIRPTMGAALTVNMFTVFGSDKVELPALVDELARQCEQVQKGELGRAEAMLVAQAHSLDSIFHALAHRSARNLGEYIDAAERYMRLALKAQSQCRATLETLAAIKNPPVVYARQANIAHGPQQVNNASSPDPRARVNQIEPNKLLEPSYEQRLDPGAAREAISGDSEMAAVGAFDRATNG